MTVPHRVRIYVFKVVYPLCANTVPHRVPECKVQAVYPVRKNRAPFRNGYFQKAMFTLVPAMCMLYPAQSYIVLRHQVRAPPKAYVYLLCSQFLPTKPRAHAQVYPPLVLRHWPAFLQGLTDAHSSTSERKKRLFYILIEYELYLDTDAASISI